jgi:HEAT repeat protein
MKPTRFAGIGLIVALSISCAQSLAAPNATTTTMPTTTASATPRQVIIIPLPDRQTEWVITPFPARAPGRWDVATIERWCRDLMLRQTAVGTFDPKAIVFDEYYTGDKQPIALRDFAEVEVRPLTFIPSEQLRDVANRLTSAKGEEAAREIWPLGGRAKNLVPLILPYLESHPYKESSSVWFVVEGIGPQAIEVIPTLVCKIKSPEEKNSQDSYFGVLRAIGDPAVPALEKLLREIEGEWPKHYAASALLNGSDTGARLVRAALGDHNPAVRVAAAQVLADVKNPSDADTLTKLLDDPDINVRRAAAHSLGVLGPSARAALPRLIELLDDANPKMQWAALDALAGIPGDPKVILPHMRPFLQAKPGDDADSNCSAALRVIKLYGPDAAALAPDVARCLERQYWYVQYTALEALESIGGKEAAVAAERAADLAADRQFAQYDSALAALLAMGPDALPAAGKMRKLLVEPDAGNRALSAIEVLGAIGPSQKDAMPALLPWVTMNYGSMSTAPERLLRILASWDADAAIKLIEVEAKKPDDDFFGRHSKQAAGAINRLKRMQADMRAVEAAVAGPGEIQLGQDDQWIDWRWARVLRPGNSLQRAVALLGRPAVAGPACLEYRNVLVDPMKPDSKRTLRIELAGGKVKAMVLNPTLNSLLN